MHSSRLATRMDTYNCDENSQDVEGFKFAKVIMNASLLERILLTEAVNQLIPTDVQAFQQTCCRRERMTMAGSVIDGRRQMNMLELCDGTCL